MKHSPAGLHGGPEPDKAQAPQVFVRSLSTPKGLPWEQRRAAELEARMGAPVALKALRYRLVRTEPWNFSGLGRFAAVYLKGSKEIDRFEASVTINGRSQRMLFLSQAAKRRATVQVLRSAGLIAVPLALLATAVLISITVCSDRDARIALLEVKSQRAETLAKRLAMARGEAKSLRSAGAEGQAVGDVVRDLDWLSRNKMPEAHLQAIHWERSMMAVTTRGETPPVRGSERELKRSEKPLGPGLWLWGIGPSGGSAHP